MIVRDEEKVLSRCLKSAEGLYDELIVVDTGSTDGTAGIAKEFTEKVFFLPWKDDFSYARNEAFSHAEGDYLLWLDADDVIEGQNFATLRDFLEKEQPDMVFCPYRAGGLVYERERFLRRDKNFQFLGRVHEAIAPQGKVVRFPLTVTHLPIERSDSRRNLDIYLKWAEEEPLSPRDLFYYGRELYYHNLYTEAAAVLEKMLKGDGWYVNKIAACETLARCFLAQNDKKGALEALFRSFLYGEPRAFILCKIGEIFFQKSKYREAAFWYEGALLCRDHTADGDFEEPACRDLTPLLQLVVCYWRLGEREKAALYNERAGAIAPAHPSVIFNRKFFDSL